MSRSSSESWRARGAADIIDLDRYMRGAVRPQVTPRADSDIERLVVDCGGPVPGGGSATRKPSTSTTSAPRDKRYSHDSGLSDGSYVRRRSHRRVMGDKMTARSHRERDVRVVPSANSMKTFRATCERALREQQEQISRVAQLCERLTRVPPPQRSVAPSNDSSDISSSSRSRSTRDRSKKNKHRTDECKTYKIIMTKLDELNRLFLARAKAAPARPSRPRPQTVSDGSVSVSDKLVATEPPPRSVRMTKRSGGVQVAYAITAGAHSGGASNKTQSTGSRAAQAPLLIERAVGGATLAAGAGAGAGAVTARLAAARAHDIDIAPEHRAKTRPAIRRSGSLNVAAESVLECASASSSAHAPHCQFDLDNPFHLYSQAKRLQTLRAATTQRRARSVESAKLTTHEHHSHSHQSLCGRCRGYWRAITSLAAQLFGRNEVTT